MAMIGATLAPYSKLAPSDSSALQDELVLHLG